MGKRWSELEEEFRALLKLKPLKLDQAKRISETIDRFSLTYPLIYSKVMSEETRRQKARWHGFKSRRNYLNAEAKIPSCPECRYYGLIQLSDYVTFYCPKCKTKFRLQKPR